MLTEEARDRLAEANPEALLADGFEAAYIGICRRFSTVVAAYDYNKCIEILMNRDGMSGEEAEEFFEFNTLGAWVGEFTPAFIEVIASIPSDTPLEAMEKLYGSCEKGNSTAGMAIRCKRLILESGVNSWEDLIRLDRKIFRGTVNFGESSYNLLKQYAEERGYKMPAYNELGGRAAKMHIDGDKGCGVCKRS